MLDFSRYIISIFSFLKKKRKEKSSTLLVVINNKYIFRMFFFFLVGGKENVIFSCLLQLQISYISLCDEEHDKILTLPFTQ
uniref:Uncharacterized protein n=1 Tax=Octopus bimaculoides TaxID=37653 RepID=A0A0L8FUL6_OCTBM